MIVIPAIDLRRKKVVRLLQGRFGKETAYSDEPVKVAKDFQAKGAKLLHLVDLDGALTGEPKNLDIAEEIIKAVDIPVQMGGGLRTDEAIAGLLSKGAARAIIGTRAYEDEGFLKRMVSEFKEKIAVSIDAVGEFVVSKGWVESTAIRAIDLARRLESLGVDTIIYTNVLKDGTLESPQMEPIEEMLDAVKIKVVVSGGISALEDIKNLKSLNRANLYGVITGKALYEGRLDLEEAIKVAEG
jgi:phosphoribosylformimino-5-aminoimidazole carboxamide ribotide isomerase